MTIPAWLGELVHFVVTLAAVAAGLFLKELWLPNLRDRSEQDRAAAHRREEEQRQYEREDEPIRRKVRGMLESHLTTLSFTLDGPLTLQHWTESHDDLQTFVDTIECARAIHENDYPRLRAFLNSERVSIATVLAGAAGGAPIPGTVANVILDLAPVAEKLGCQRVEENFAVGARAFLEA